MRLEQRKNIRLPGDQYIGPRLYFATLCCEGRRRTFANPAAAAMLVRDLKSVSATAHFLLHAYCVMPDHLHLLVEGQTDDAYLPAYIKKLKRKTGYSLRQETEGELWQSRYYDHILRRDADADGVAWYIWMNPVRQRLVSDAGQYPFSGSCMVDWPKGQHRAGEWMPPWKSGVSRSREPERPD